MVHKKIENSMMRRGKTHKLSRIVLQLVVSTEISRHFLQCMHDKLNLVVVFFFFGVWFWRIEIFVYTSMRMNNFVGEAYSVVRVYDRAAFRPEIWSLFWIWHNSRAKEYGKKQAANNYSVWQIKRIYLHFLRCFVFIFPLPPGWIDRNEGTSL